MRLALTASPPARRTGRSGAARRRATCTRPATGLPDHFTKGNRATSSSRARRRRLTARTWRTSSGWPSSARKATATSPWPTAGCSSARTTRTRATRGTSGDRSILMCFDEKTGELLWQLVVPKLASGKVNDWESLGLLSSPTIEGDRVYIVTSRCEVLCLDSQRHGQRQRRPVQGRGQIRGPGRNPRQGQADRAPAPPIEPGPKDADIIWRYDMMDELGVFPHNASDCAPLIVGDLRLRQHVQRPGLDAFQHPLAQRAQPDRAGQAHRRIPRPRTTPRSARASSTAYGVPPPRAASTAASSSSSAAATASATRSTPSR